MRTLDIRDTHDGLVIVNGFGDKDWDTAVYLDGKLVGQDRDGFDEEQVSTKLSKLLTQKLGLSWEERITHIWWRRSFWSEAPATLVEYDAKTIEGYREAKEHDFAQFIEDKVHVPRKAEDEVRIAAVGYELSGGDSEQFDAWYKTWLTEHQTFNDRFRTEVAARLTLEARRQATYDNGLEVHDNLLLPEIQHHTKGLETLLIGYMCELYRTDKPLDPVAKRARG